MILSAEAVHLYPKLPTTHSPAGFTISIFLYPNSKVSSKNNSRILSNFIIIFWSVILFTEMSAKISK